MIGIATIPPAVTVAEAQAFVRVETGDEEAILAGLIRTATSLCESFIGQAIIARAFSEIIPASSSWQRLTSIPVQAISGAESVEADGSTTAIASTDYGVDIDAEGCGWLRLVRPADPCRVRVTGTVGLAEGESDVPEPVRQGILRLVAHLYAARDGGGGEPPAAVTALWRPYRRMTLR